MKIENDYNKTIIFLKKELVGSLDFNNIDSLENYLKELFLKLKNIYNMEIKGFYNIKVFIDSIYGMVLELEAEDLEYGDYFNQIEMRIIPIYTEFLYKIEDYINIKGKVYIYKNEIYLKVNKNISNKDYLKVMDHAKIVYNNTDNIIKYGYQLNHFIFN